MALSVNSLTLRTLDLGKNGITNEGIQYLAGLFKINKTLTDLSL
jgi:hypothetical protein